jgi:hypothetical protein
MTKEFPISWPSYYPRTCGWKNKKKNAKRILKSLCHGSLGNFTGSSMIRSLDLDKYWIEEAEEITREQ